MKWVIVPLLVFISIYQNIFAGNGWSSSGGGEYIIDEKNPWFMGDEPVKWCIDYGGEDKFSLPLSKAQVEVSKGLEALSIQVSSINLNINEILYPDRQGRRVDRTCTDLKCDGWNLADGKAISHKFVFTQDCKEADLEIILGNYENKKIRELIADIGVEKFRKLAGVAIRTEYSILEYRGKGFIYIAADKGELQYSGARNARIAGTTIWNNHEKLDSKAIFPPSIIFSTKQEKEIYQNYPFKYFTMGALEPVIAHEFGHVLGLGHNHYSNLMDEDYPANIIMNGLAFKGNYLRESMLFSRGLIESNIPIRLGFEWHTGKLKMFARKKVETNSPLVYKFLFDLPEEYKGMPEVNIFFIFEMDAKKHISVATYEINNPRYRVLKKYRYIENPDCSAPSEVESITLRSTVPLAEYEGYDYDSEVGKWLPTEVRNGEMVSTLRLLSLYNNYFCGMILLNSGNSEEFIRFKLTHSYFSNPSELELIEGNTERKVFLTLKDSELLNKGSLMMPLQDIIIMPALKFK